MPSTGQRVLFTSTMFLAGVGLGMTVPVPALGLVGLLSAAGGVRTLARSRVDAAVEPIPVPALVPEPSLDLLPIEVDAGKSPAEYLEETLVLTFA